MKKFTLAFIAFFIISTRLNAQNTTRYLTSEPSENKTMKPEETEYYSPVPSEVKGVPNFASPTFTSNGVLPRHQPVKASAEVIAVFFAKPIQITSARFLSCRNLFKRTGR